MVEVGVAGRKHKQRNDIKYLMKSFSSFKYRSHHEGQHAASWTEYQGMLVDQKNQYFNGRIKATNTMHHHFDLDKDTYELFIYTEIVDVIIGDLFFHDDEQLENIDADDGEHNLADTVRKKLIKKENEKKNTMKLFCKEDDVLVYMVTIKDILRFDLVMDCVGIGLSFQRTATTVQKAKDRTKMASMTTSSVSTRASWSLSRCNKSLASSTMSRFGPCR
jgi:hypothetical protein